MDLAQMATQFFQNKVGGNAIEGDASSALSGLLGSGDNINLGDIVGKLQNGGGELANLAKSWLGDGDNLPIDASQVTQLLGSDKVKGFAQQLGLGEDQAAEGLSQMLPNLIDKTSQGGNFLESIGGMGGLAGMASKFFK